MTEKESALYSQYIIDGVRCDATPAELLDECMDPDSAYSVQEDGFEDIVDESTEPPISTFASDEGRIMEDLQKTLEASAEERPFRMLYPSHFTRLQISKALISRLWSEGHHRLGDLRLWAQWEWNTRHIGSMAAFYESAAAASEYIYGTGVKLQDYLFMECDEASHAKFFAWLPEENESEEPDEMLFKSSPYESRHPWIGEGRKCPATLKADPDSWIIYIPFDTCAYRLGGSLLAELNGHNGGPAPQIQDPDYFIDCYEVVRELVEDGIVMAGVTVADGGLATAAARLSGEYGIDMSVDGIMSSYQEKDKSRVLFSEVPGVLLQVSNENYDYTDAQLILQDIAYYPIGHPSSHGQGVSLTDAARADVAGILASLIGQASEGED